MIAIKPALSLIFAAGLALAAVIYFDLSQGYWLIVSALLCLQVSVSVTTLRKLILFPVFALLAVGLVMLATLLAPLTAWLALYLFAMTFAVVFVGLWFADLWCAALMLNILVLWGAGLPVSMQDNMQRGLCIVSGCALAALSYLVFLRRSREKSLRFLLAACLRDLMDLQQTIFAVYLQRDYKNQLFSYEKKLHNNRRDFLYSLMQAKKFLPQAKNYIAVIALIEQIYAIILALGLLLYRVDDHTTFEVAGKEFSALNIALTTALETLAKNLRIQQYGDILGQELPEAIQELEEVNRNALQVVAHDPLTFMLFIRDLTVLDEHLVQLATAIAEVTPQ